MSQKGNEVFPLVSAFAVGLAVFSAFLSAGYAVMRLVDYCGTLSFWQRGM